MSAHTPGPWRWVENADAVELMGPTLTESQQREWHRGETCNAIGHDPMDCSGPILEVENDGFTPEYFVTAPKPDALLIAAAPDMLAALEAVAMALAGLAARGRKKGHLQVFPKHLDDIWDKVTDAITKAKG